MALFSPSNYWYYVITATNPTTQVWEISSGTMVSNTSATYKTWLSDLLAAPDFNIGYISTITGAANNGSGLIRITYSSAIPTTWTTGQTKTITGVVGTTEANAAWAITVIDSTHVDLQASTFTNAYVSGGLIGSGPTIATTAAISASAATNLPAYSSISVSTVTSTATLTNPINRLLQVTMASSAQIINLPQMNLYNSIPLLSPITFVNLGSNSFVVKGSAGTTLATVQPGEIKSIILYDNTSTTEGLFQSTNGIVPLIYGGAGVSLSATGGTSQFLKQNTVGGNVTVVQPAFTDISGTATVAQLPKSNFISVNRNGVDQGAVANSTITKIQFNNKLSDVDSVFDAVTNFRYTPNIAGIYEIVLNTIWTTAIGAGLAVGAGIYKNSAEIAFAFNVASATGGFSCVSVPVKVSMNGTTDFIEFECFQNSGGAAALGGNASRTSAYAMRVG